MSVRVVVNKKAVEQLLKETAMPLLERKANAIRDAAGEGHEVETHVGRNRARATVRTATFRARYAEAQYQRLSRSIDAGRAD